MGRKESNSERPIDSPVQRRLSKPKKFLFAGLTLVLLIAALETVLTLAGVEPPRPDRDPFVGFASSVRHFDESTDAGGVTVLATAESKLKHFNPQSFPKEKPPGAYRIFCVGGSTTYGRPFYDNTSFAGWLREALPVVDASRTWEVVNAGGISYASYRVALVVEELCRYQPDLFVVYMGHNEFLERRTYGDMLETSSLVLDAAAWVNRTRTATVVRSILGLGDEAPNKRNVLPDQPKAIAVDLVGPEAYTRDDTMKQQVVAHFRETSERIIHMAAQAGAEVVLVTPAANLAHFAPFKSEHLDALTAEQREQWEDHYAQAQALEVADLTEKAIDALDRAEAIDDRYAEAHYRKAHLLMKLKRWPEARASFIRALEEDICPLRAINAIVTAVREIAGERDVGLVDFVAILDDRAADGITGDEYFVDHVHTRICANRILAESIIDRLIDRKIVGGTLDWRDEVMPHVAARVHASIDPVAHAGELRHLASMLDWLGQPEQALKRLQESHTLTPGDPVTLLMIASLHYKSGNALAAERFFREAIDADPDQSESRLRFGVFLARRNRPAEAVEHLRHALRLDPNHYAAHEHLGLIHAQRGRLEESLHHFTETVNLQPDSADAHNNRGLVLAKMRRFEEAIAEYQIAMRLDPDSPATLYNYGLALTAMNRPQDALEQFRDALRIDPEHQGAKREIDAIRSER